MNPFACYRLHFTPLSPIHIGAGESYEPTNYVIEDGALHEFDTGAAMAALSGKDREELLRIASGKPNADMLKAVQRFFFERRDALKPWAVNRIPVLPGVAEFYASRVGQTTQRKGNGKDEINKLAIQRLAHNPVSYKPVLFGSSLKGSMRTALLDKLNNRNPLSRHDAELFQLEGLPDYERKRRERSHSSVFKKLNEKLVQGSFELDPLRLLQISDAYWQAEDNLPSAQVCFAVDRKKQPKVEKKDLYHTLECVLGWRYRAFSGQINVQRVNGISEIGRKGQRQLPVADLRFDMAQVTETCNAFYWPILLMENEVMRNRGYLDPDWDQSIQKLLEMARSKLDQGQVFLLRVGRHSGAESVTLDGVRNVKILLEKDKDTGKQRYTYEPKTRTLWLAANDKDQRTNLLPFGWLLVEVEPLEAPARDWPELRALCEPHLTAARAFAAKLESQQKAMEQARVAAEAQRREEEEKARRAAEQAAREEREEAERQAQLAAMSKEQRRVLDLGKELTPASKGKGKGHALFVKLRDLIDEASTWSPEDKALLREAAAKAYEHLSVKKDDYKKLLRSLSA
jgi:CRISPR-associated protein Csm5